MFLGLAHQPSSLSAPPVMLGNICAAFSYRQAGSVSEKSNLGEAGKANGLVGSPSLKPAALPCHLQHTPVALGGPGQEPEMDVSLEVPSIPFLTERKEEPCRGLMRSVLHSPRPSVVWGGLGIMALLEDAATVGSFQS